jgi:ferric-dicitrate binding protein FerR (iron transport regulator)
MSEITDDVSRTAARWLARRRRGLNEAEQEELVAWLIADERHSAAFAAAEIDLVTDPESGARRKAGPAPEPASAPAPRLPPGPHGRRRRTQGWVAVAFGGSAILLAIYYLTSR